MIWQTLTGRKKNISIKPYLVCWDCDQGSDFSTEVLEFLYPYWRHDVVACELIVAGTKMRFDYVNLSKKIIVETDGEQHDDPDNYWNQSDKFAYGKQMKRDLLKDRFAELNGFKMVRIKPRDLPLSRKWFEEFYGIIL